jgi:DNA-binding NtrC family response regulator
MYVLRNLLLVEDNKLLSLMEAKHLRTAFPDVALSIAKDVDEAILSARSNLPEVIIMDCKLPGGDCCSLLNDLLDISPKSTVVVTSAEPPDDLRGRSYRDKIFDILEKPFETEELVYVVGRALKATNRGIDSKGDLKNNERNVELSVSLKTSSFDRHQVLNVLSGILAGIRAFEADLEADYNEPEAVKDDVAEYVPRLVEMVNKVTGLIKMAGH